jgi:5-formyltetrahydrofolate cyclo-ligase
MGMNVSEAKQSLRISILSKRKETPNHSEVFAQRILELCQNIGAKTVGCYLSFGTEPDTREFIEKAKASGIEIACPKILDDGSMIFAKYQGETSMSKLGFEEPNGEVISDLDLVVVPALAVNNRGERLGRGAGYFDRFLESYRGITVALVFDSEILDTLPVEPHDRPVDYLISPSDTSQV